MAKEPQTWHYGLVARWWSEFNIGGPEVAYFQGVIERYGQPALDVACGTGRLLLPYLRAGIDVDGCDISPDMLALCADKAVRERLAPAPRLYNLAMHELDLPRIYKTIFACGSFGIGGDRQWDLEALRRFYRHLQPGGAFVFDHVLPYSTPQGWYYWLLEHRSQLPRAWEPSGDRRCLSDGTEIDFRSRVIALDPLEQTYAYQALLEQWRDGEPIAQEEHILRGCMYFKNELVMMLEQAGFRDVAVYGAYTEAEATADQGELVFSARK